MRGHRSARQAKPLSGKQLAMTSENLHRDR
jgi:hypothetical protein